MISGSMTRPRVPLKAFQHLKTNNLGVLEKAVGRFYPGAKFELGSSAKGIDAVANRFQARDVAVAYSKLGTRLRIDIPDLDVYALLFSFGGGARAQIGREEVEIAANRALIGSGSGAVRLDYAAEFEHLLLSVSPQALATKLEALTGVALNDRIEFKNQADFRHPDTESLRRMFMLLVDHLDSPAPFHPLALAEFEQALIVSFLMANDSNYSLLLHRNPRAAAPWQVRLAEAYIEANWDQPLTIEALVVITGVSARTLFHSFRKSRGYSPMDFAKRIRLERARGILQRAEDKISVTTVAFACGFGNLGHFSGYYRGAFGETPSATLRRALKPH
jgi:AraC-like DNA-binding protein